MLKHVKNNDFSEVLEEKIALVDFSASWCGPCQMLAPVVEELSQDMAAEAAFYGVDVDENEELARKFGIMSVPTILVFKEGNKVAQTVGFQSKENLATLLKENM